MSYDNNRPKEVLRNTITIPKESDGEKEFVTCPPGQQTLGLVKIKNATISNAYQTGAGYRFVLRSRAVPEAFVSVEVMAKGSKSSGLFKLLNRMSGGLMTPEIGKDSDALFAFMQKQIGHWFLGTVEHTEWTPPNSNEVITFVRVMDKNLIPHPEDAKFGNCVDYFKKGVRTVSVGESEAKRSGFEDMPDHGKESQKAKSDATEYMYKIVLSDDKEKRTGQLKFLDSVKAKFNAITGNYHTLEEVKKLEKFFKGYYDATPVEEETDFDDSGVEEDDIPF